MPLIIDKMPIPVERVALTTYGEIEAWLKFVNITDYEIADYGNDGLMVNVGEDVNLCSKHLIFIPIKFHAIDGNFNISMNYLTSLEGCPNSVYGEYDCSNNLLTSLEFGPSLVCCDFFM